MLVCHSTYATTIKKTCTAWFPLRPQMYSPANVRAFFSVQSVNFARLLCALAKTSPVFFLVFMFLPEFSSVKILRKMWATLWPDFFREKKRRKKNGRQTSGWACRTRVQNFRVLSLKNGVDIGLLCVKVSKIRCFLQMTWF